MKFALALLLAGITLLCDVTSLVLTPRMFSMKHAHIYFDKVCSVSTLDLIFFLAVQLTAGGCACASHARTADGCACASHARTSAAGYL
jgi:hypothetical protein